MSANINTGGAACSRCSESAVRKQGHQQLCAKHYRFGQMRVTAKRHGKLVPSHEELAAMRGVDLVCPDCCVTMNWLAGDGQATVVSLQHYRDGSMALTCRSCNTRHAAMPSDTFREQPPGHKWCPRCRTSKPFSEFNSDNGRSGPMKLKSHCIECASKAHLKWQRNNREHYNMKQRESRAARAAAANGRKEAA